MRRRCARMWPTVREKVRERSRTVEVMLAGAVVRAVEGNTLFLSTAGWPGGFCEQRNADVIRDALKDALGVNWQVRCEAGGVGGSAPAGPPTPVPESTDAAVPANARRKTT